MKLESIDPSEIYQIKMTLKYNGRRNLKTLRMKRN